MTEYRDIICSNVFDSETLQSIKEIAESDGWEFVKIIHDKPVAHGEYLVFKDVSFTDEDITIMKQACVSQFGSAQAALAAGVPKWVLSVKDSYDFFSHYMQCKVTQDRCLRLGKLKEAWTLYRAFREKVK